MAEHVINLRVDERKRYTNDPKYHLDVESRLIKLLETYWISANTQNIVPKFYLNEKDITHDLAMCPAVIVFENYDRTNGIGLGYVAESVQMPMTIEAISLDRGMLFDVKDEIHRILMFCRKRPISGWDFILTTSNKRAEPRAGNYHFITNAVLYRLVRPIPDTKDPVVPPTPEPVIISYPPSIQISAVVHVDTELTAVCSSTPSGGISPYTYAWFFDDVSPPVTTKDATHTFEDLNSISTLLEVTDSQRKKTSGSLSFNIVGQSPPVIPLPTGDFNVGVVGTISLLEFPLTINYTTTVSGGTAPYTYAWYFDDISPPIVTPDTSHTYAQIDDIRARLVVSDSKGIVVTASVVFTLTPISTPEVFFSSPTTNGGTYTYGTPITSVSGTANSANLIEVKTNGEEWVSATGTSSWSSQIGTIIGGTNIIQARPKFNDTYGETEYINIVEPLMSMSQLGIGWAPYTTDYREPGDNFSSFMTIAQYNNSISVFTSSSVGGPWTQVSAPSILVRPSTILYLKTSNDSSGNKLPYIVVYDDVTSKLDIYRYIGSDTWVYTNLATVDSVLRVSAASNLRTNEFAVAVGRYSGPTYLFQGFFNDNGSLASNNTFNISSEAFNSVICVGVNGYIHVFYGNYPVFQPSYRHMYCRPNGSNINILSDTSTEIELTMSDDIISFGYDSNGNAYIFSQFLWNGSDTRRLIKILASDNSWSLNSLPITIYQATPLIQCPDTNNMFYYYINRNEGQNVPVKKVIFDKDTFNVVNTVTVSQLVPENYGYFASLALDETNKSVVFVSSQSSGFSPPRIYFGAEIIS